VTVTRYPGNPDFHEVPPRCTDCGQFCGGFDSGNPAVWKRREGYDLPDTHVCRCLDCAADYVQEEYGVETDEDAYHEVLAAISGGELA
jgi:hypothetical protein